MTVLVTVVWLIVDADSKSAHMTVLFQSLLRVSEMITVITFNIAGYCFSAYVMPAVHPMTRKKQHFWKIVFGIARADQISGSQTDPVSSSAPEIGMVNGSRTEISGEVELP